MGYLDETVGIVGLATRNVGICRNSDEKLLLMLNPKSNRMIGIIIHSNLRHLQYYSMYSIVNTVNTVIAVNNTYDAEDVATAVTGVTVVTVVTSDKVPLC